MISRIISAAAVAAAAVWLGGCSSSETSTLANGLIAGATLNDANNVNGGATVGQSQGTTFAVAAGTEPDTTDVNWNSGPYSGKTRTFALDPDQSGGGINALTYADPGKEEGILFVADTGNDDAGFAVGAMHTIGKTDAAIGATHFGTAPTNIPTTGTRAYVATNAGATVNGTDGAITQFAPGTANITADFGTGDVNGTLTSADLSDITFAGKMSAGNTVYAANNADILYGGEAVNSNSKLIGGFYGYGASSTAGVYDVTTLDPTPIRAVGGFASIAPP
jgi:hypothetical protein